ncbi:MAG: clostripain-related cysteine peptidase [Alistipes indistinctus]
MQANLEGLVQGMTRIPAENGRIIAYLDTPGDNPRLVEVTAVGTKELYRWPSAQNSASAATVREVIDRVRRTAPAERYGLVLWSHGMAWLPSSATGYFVKSCQRSEQAWPATKYFRAGHGCQPDGLHRNKRPRGGDSRRDV